MKKKLINSAALRLQEDRMFEEEGHIESTLYYVKGLPYKRLANFSKNLSYISFLGVYLLGIFTSILYSWPTGIITSLCVFSVLFLSDSRRYSIIIKAISFIILFILGTITIWSTEYFALLGLFLWGSTFTGVVFYDIFEKKRKTIDVSEEEVKACLKRRLNMRKNNKLAALLTHPNCFIRSCVKEVINEREYSKN